MPSRGRQAVLEAPFLVPSESPQFRARNSLTHSIRAQPDPSPRDGETSGVLVAGCSQSTPRQGWVEALGKMLEGQRLGRRRWVRRVRWTRKARIRGGVILGRTSRGHCRSK